MNRKVIIAVFVVLIMVIFCVALFIPNLINKNDINLDDNNNIIKNNINYKIYNCKSSFDSIDITKEEDVGNNITAKIIAGVGKYSVEYNYNFTINDTYNIIDVLLVDKYTFEKIEGFNFNKDLDSHIGWTANLDDDNLTKTYTMNEAPINYMSLYMSEDGTNNYVAYIESLGYTCSKE